MSKIPQNPSEWEHFLQSYSIPDLPYRNLLVQDADVFTQRDVYVDVIQAMKAQKSVVEVYADVLAFPEGDSIFTITEGGYAVLNARVVTATAPVKCTIKFAGQGNAAFQLWATQLDQPISISTGSGQAYTLELGKSSANVGVEIRFTNGSTTISYFDKHQSLELASAQVQKLAQTQLRMSSILFWLSPVVAADIALHVARVCASSQVGAALCMQAKALGQQLAITNTTGKGVDPAPTLKLETYQKTLAGVLDVTDGFQTQYDNFRNSQHQLANQIAAWDAMIQKSKDIFNVNVRLSEDARKRWQDAREALDGATLVLRRDKIDLDDKEMRFQIGLEEWRRHKLLEAAFQILCAIVTFAVAIGAMAIGDPAVAAGAPGEAASAIKTAEEAADAAGVIGKLLDTDTMQTLADGLEAIGDLADSISDIADNLNSAEEGNTDIPVVDDTDTKSPDPSGLAQMAAWDKWTLDVDSQMAFAVEEEIEGAAEYRLALRKYAIDGKVVTQSRVEANRAAYEYFERQAEAIVAQRDFERLKTLRDGYEGQEDVAAAAAEAFYDRMMSAITSVLIEMRKANWAFKYMTLKDSRVFLDPLKTIQDYRADAQMLVQQIEDWEEGRTSDFAPFTETFLASKLGSAANDTVVNRLKTEGTAMFTLAPPANIGPFENGQHIRIIGMRAYLVGATAIDPAKTESMEIRISSSGMYTDTQDGQFFTFVMPPDIRPFKYLLPGPGSHTTEDLDSGVERDSFIPSGDFADPTPFTQWTIAITNPSAYDLSGLTDVKLVWRGRMK